MIVHYFLDRVFHWSCFKSIIIGLTSRYPTAIVLNIPNLYKCRAECEKLILCQTILNRTSWDHRIFPKRKSKEKEKGSPAPRTRRASLYAGPIVEHSGRWKKDVRPCRPSQGAQFGHFFVKTARFKYASYEDIGPQGVGAQSDPIET